MKYVKKYLTISNATLDETVVSPVIGYCHENTLVFGYNSGTIDLPLQITALDGKISVQEKPSAVVLSLIIGNPHSYTDINDGNDVTIQYESGMTWGEWAASEYNTAFPNANFDGDSWLGGTDADVMIVKRWKGSGWDEFIYFVDNSHKDSVIDGNTTYTLEYDWTD